MRTPSNKRMGPLSAMVLRFVGLFIAVLIALAVAWPAIVPAYTRWATATARLGFYAIESPNVSVLEARGDELWVYRIIGPGTIQPYTWFDRYTFFAVIPLVALFAATPGLGLLGRLTRLGIGLGLLFLLQTGFVVASIRLSYAAIGLAEVGPFVARTLAGCQVLTRVLWEAAPLGIWVALTAGAWSRRLKSLRDEQRRGRETQQSGIKGLRYAPTKGWES
jgi:hypothetical protein